MPWQKFGPNSVAHAFSPTAPGLPTYSNKAILFYLHASGNDSAFEALKFESNNEELQLDDPQNKRFQGLLEKKWTSLIRLQKKVCSSCYPYIISLQALADTSDSFRLGI